MGRDRRWNHNLHYAPLLLAAMPERCERALDVGCGEGTLARELRRAVPHVTGIDPDEPSIAIAHGHDGPAVDYVVGDVLTHTFTPASFDFVVSVAALHHMDEERGLRRMAELLRPGGALAVLGLARSRYPADLPRELAAVVVTNAHRLAKGQWESPAPTVWPPPHTYAEVRDLVARTLPGARFRRHLLWRWSAVWAKPT